jgi:anti-anti-sigma regulatory factor
MNWSYSDMSGASQQNAPSNDQAGQLVDGALQTTQCSPTEPSQNGDNSRLSFVLEGALGIATVGELYHRLQPLLEQDQNIQIDAGAVTSVDTAVLQLFVAFVLATRASGLDVHWECPSQSLRQAVTLLGLERSLGLVG